LSVRSSRTSAKLATQTFRAQTANEQPLLAIAEELPGPGGKATINELHLSSSIIGSVDMETRPNIISSTSLPVGIEFAEDIGVLSHQRLTYLLNQGLLPPPLFEIRESDSQAMCLITKARHFAQQAHVKGDLLDQAARLKLKRSFITSCDA